jgi:glutaredoxin
MPVKLFGVVDEAESKQAMSLLEEAEIDYELIEPEATLMGYQVMWAVTGSRRTPVLCVNGRAYRGLSGVQSFFAAR